MDNNPVGKKVNTPKVHLGKYLGILVNT